MESYCFLCTFKVPQGAKNLILCTLDTIHRLFFATRWIINKINKVQWVDFKLENVLVSLHSHDLIHNEILPKEHFVFNFCIGECPSNSPFLKDNGAEAPKGPRPIVFKEWRDTRTFSNLKSTHCTLLLGWIQYVLNYS
jgi:hypothetical protein